MKIPIALTIAGSDSSGGAGIQADLKTFSALEVYGASVITALTAQNTIGVNGVFEVDTQFISDQIDAVCSDLEVSAVKIGMLHSSAVIETVAQALDRHQIGHVVLDPVMVSKSGHELLQTEAVNALKTVLIPMASIITPNIPEAAKLLNTSGEKIAANMENAAERLLSLGCGAVLLKGGHLQSEQSVDIYFDGNNAKHLAEPRFNTNNTHGTGCTLSSAICAYLARRIGLDEAVTAAKKYITNSIRSSDQLDIGHGHGPVHHFSEIWRKR